MPRIKHKSQHFGAFTSNGVKCLNPVVTIHMQQIPFFFFIRSSCLPNSFSQFWNGWLPKSHPASNSNYGPKIPSKVR